MNKREAKSEACFVVAALIQAYLDGGQPYDECNENGDDKRYKWRPKDADSLSKAFEELRDELERRARTPEKKRPE